MPMIAFLFDFVWFTRHKLAIFASHFIRWYFSGNPIEEYFIFTFFSSCVWVYTFLNTCAQVCEVVLIHVDEER